MDVRVPLALLACAAIAAAGAPLAHADDATAAERAAVLQVTDLGDFADVAMGSFSVKAGGDTPAVCGETTDGVYATGSRSQRAVSQRVRTGSWEWDSDVYAYASQQAATASYARMKSAASRMCRPLLHETSEDEGYTTSIILGDVPGFLKAKAGMPRFTVDSFVIARSLDAEGDQWERYAYTVIYQAGRTILEVEVQARLPLTKADMEQVRDTALVVARRAAQV
jgi:hypothetical protein